VDDLFAASLATCLLVVYEMPCDSLKKETMTPADAIDLGREALFTALMVGAPILLVGTLVGLAIGLLQALTQVQDQTVAFVPKLVAMVAALAICLPWVLERMMEYSTGLLTNIPQAISGQ
jgi:flagellar biosynthetic protein FliQ